MLIFNERTHFIRVINAAIQNAKPTRSSLSRCRYQLPYVLSADAILLNDFYQHLGVAASNEARRDEPALRIPEAMIDRRLLLDGSYFYQRSTGPFMGNPQHCREYLFRAWWTLRRLGLRPPMSFNLMLTAATKFPVSVAEVRRYCHAA